MVIGQVPGMPETAVCAGTVPVPALNKCGVPGDGRWPVCAGTAAMLPVHRTIVVQCDTVSQNYAIGHSRGWSAVLCPPPLRSDRSVRDCGYPQKGPPRGCVFLVMSCQRRPHDPIVSPNLGGVDGSPSTPGAGAHAHSARPTARTNNKEHHPHEESHRRIRG